MSVAVVAFVAIAFNLIHVADARAEDCSESPRPDKYPIPLSAANMHAIGLSYAIGDGIEKDFSRALSWYHCAVSAGSVGAMTSIAFAYMLGEGVEKDLVNSIQWFSRAAEFGDGVAHGYLALAYGNGEGIPINVPLSVKHAKAGAALGDVNSLRWLIYYLETGIGLQQNAADATQWRIRLFEAIKDDEAKQDEAPKVAQKIAYEYAQGGPLLVPNPDKAVEWFEVAAKLGKDVSKAELALRKHWGYGTPRDNAGAIQWMTNFSVENGNDAMLFDLSQESLAETRITPCSFVVDPGQEVMCGRVLLPQDYSDPQSPTLSLPFAIWRSDRGVAVQPPVLIPGGGGPGGAVGLDSRMGGYLSSAQWEILNEGADLIIVDQRGAGESIPKLACKEQLSETLKLWTTKPSERDQLSYSRAIRKCLDRWIEQGVRLRSFTTANSARDFNEIRKALGFTRWTILGTSYGARLALLMAQNYPDSVSSLILDSPDSPLDVFNPASTTSDITAALDRVIDACESSAECSEDFPTLREDSRRVIERLAKDPLHLTITDPRTLTNLEIYLGGEDIHGLVRDASYGLLERVPRALTALSNGSTGPLERLIEDLEWFSPDYAAGLNASVVCQEKYPAIYEVILAQRSGSNTSRNDDAINDIKSLDHLCAAFAPESGRQPIEWHIDELDVPTLVLAGALDSTTPASSSEELADLMPTAFFQELPSCGHDVLSCSSCARQLLWRFLRHPTVDPRTYYCEKSDQKIAWERVYQ